MLWCYLWSCLCLCWCFSLWEWSCRWSLVDPPSSLIWLGRRKEAMWLSDSLNSTRLTSAITMLVKNNKNTFWIILAELGENDWELFQCLLPKYQGEWILGAADLSPVGNVSQQSLPCWPLLAALRTGGLDFRLNKINLPDLSLIYWLWLLIKWIWLWNDVS